jgi:hypothetical protein
VSFDSPAPVPTSGGNATTALVLGIVGVVGSLGSCCCCLFAVLGLCSPIAWYLGHRELAAIRAGLAPAYGETNARTGMVLGIVGSALLALYILAMLAYVGLVGFAVATESLKHGGVPPLPQ